CQSFHRTRQVNARSIGIRVIRAVAKRLFVACDFDFRGRIPSDKTHGAGRGVMLLVGYEMRYLAVYGDLGILKIRSPIPSRLCYADSSVSLNDDHLKAVPLVV